MRTKQRRAIKSRLITGKNNIVIFALLGIIVFGGALMVGLFSINIKSDTSLLSQERDIVCCDTGDGDACKPQTGPDQKITYNGTEYGLLRSDVKFIEGNLHLLDSGQSVSGKPIVLNSSQDHALNLPIVQEGCERPNPLTEKRDLYFAKTPPDPYMFMTGYYTLRDIQTYCTSVPDDEIIYVCKENCQTSACSFSHSDPSIKCYGNNDSVYDVYFRLSDANTPGIPDFIKNCDKSGYASQQQSGGKQIIVTPTGGDKSSQESLQLQTFSILGDDQTNPFFSPLCKPAIYLYPQEKTHVSVEVFPKGPMTLTIPLYPQNGWSVTAYPDGRIMSNNTLYEYLYYEAKIPDHLVSEGDTGYVVEKAKIKELLTSLLPKLGLNNAESKAFIDYWASALTSSPYYAVRIVPEDELNTLAPLAIKPKPDTIIRATLHFTPLEKKITLKEPVISTPIRKGFTVVEWGGLYKQDKDHPFTCLM